MSTKIKSNRGRKSTKKMIEQKECPENVKTLYEFYDIKPVKIELNNIESKNTDTDLCNDTDLSNNIDLSNNTDLSNNVDLSNNTDLSNNENEIKGDFINENTTETLNENNNDIPQKVYKKRGRKPKGGKIIKQPISVKDESVIKQNIILHLKCSINDVDDNIFGNNTSYNPNIIENIGGYSFNNKELQFDYVKSKEIVDYESIIYSNKPINSNNTVTNDIQNNWSNNIENTNLSTNNSATNNSATNNSISNLNTNVLKNNLVQSLNNINQSNNQSNTSNIKQHNTFNNNDESENNNVKDIWRKLYELEKSLHNNDVYDKKSSCFWDTCEFDNPPIYIPKFELNGVVQVYGCFCSPECAVAYLMKENIDTTTKFERYHLLNHTYCKIYNYEKNIKPSPLPYYTLNKYYGNLTIQEYRKLLKNERLLLIVDKPLTIQLPELHQDNDEHIINNSIPSTAKYKLRRKGVKQSKNEILNETFGLCK
jgi:hypothetical protein